MGDKGKENKATKMSLVIDSDIFIDTLRGEENAVEFIRGVVKEDVFFSAITETELLSGKECEDDKKKEGVLHVLALFNKVIVDNKVAQIAGDIRRKYNVLTPDAIIAATAFLTNSVLITRNIKDFEKIKGLQVKKPY